MKVTRQWLDSPEPTTRDDERREIEYNAFAAGRAAGLREAVEAVEAQLCTWRSQLADEHGKFIEMIFRDEAIAAIRAAGPEVGE